MQDKLSTKHFTESNYCLLPTTMGFFRMYDTGSELVRLISFGDISNQGDNPLLRMHSSCLASEVFGAKDCDCADQLLESMKMIATEGAGIIIHLEQEGRGQGLSSKIQAVSLMQVDEIDTVESFERLGLEPDIRSYEKAIEILSAFGFTKLRLITNNPTKKKALEDAGIVVELVHTNPNIRVENEAYLHSKNEKLNHSIPLAKSENDDSPIHFYHSDQPWGEFSNFSKHPIFLKQVIWQTVEHFYQAQKFRGTALESEIRLAQSPMQAKIIAELNQEKYDKVKWQEAKETVMMEALKAKFTQHPQLKQKLISTKNRHIAEHTKNDLYWGDGHDGSGQNRLGELIMLLRKEWASC